MPGSVQSIERAAAILRLLAEAAGPMRVSEIAEALGLATPTTHGLLRTLCQVGFVSQDGAGGKYRLGAALLDLGGGPLDLNELRSHAINWADPLAARTGEAVRIGALQSGAVVIVHHVFRPDDTQQKLDVGSSLPAHATALGKALLAYAPNLAVFVSKGLPPYSHRTITTVAGLRAALGQVRQRGWASEVEEMTVGQAGVAVPIRGPGGLVVGAIGVSGAVDRICDPSGRPRPGVVSRVREAARAVSRDLAEN
ncbi:IclR family transcriptional regulator [Cryptosporangium phraense]|uniref:Glycerol operon regulatory protein n=1 Tax=Cryptosporangium phraense TaxID=2593070 RepID=A0A545AWZ2_9ACTN|nr:IclR family transcriptional regulator [Cryptosporangium phraense]TQS45840.1 IclR family transcriptional regulator [Cryptosporangium phraense]